MIILDFQEWLAADELRTFEEGFLSDQAWPAIRKRLKWAFGPAAPYVAAILELSAHVLSKGSLEATWKDVKDPGEKAQTVFNHIVAKLKKMVGKGSEQMENDMPTILEFIQSVFGLIRSAIFSVLYMGPVPAPLLILCFGGDQRTFDEIISVKHEIEASEDFLSTNAKRILSIFWKLVELLQKICAMAIIPTKLAKEKNPMDWENIKNLAKDIRQQDN